MGTQLIKKSESLRCAITRTTRENGSGFWCVEYQTKAGHIKWDYPVCYYHNGLVVWDSLKLPKTVRNWATKQIRSFQQ